MDQTQLNLLEDHQSSKQKRKQFFIIFFIIFFALIICAIISVFTVLKHHTESQSLSANPMEAIAAVCRVTDYYGYCINSLSSLQYPRPKINAPDVFQLSIYAAFREFLTIHELPQKLAAEIENRSIGPVLIDCQHLFNDSFDQLNRSLIVITRNYDDGIMNDLRNSIEQARKNVVRCLDGLDAGKATTRQEAVRMKDVRESIRRAEIYMLISLAILENEDSVREMFDPSLQSVLASFMLTRENYVFSIVVFCSQYLFLVFLFSSLLRVFK